MSKKHTLSTSLMLCVFALCVSSHFVSNTSYASESKTVIDSLSFDYKILDERSDGTFKFSGSLPVLSLEAPIEPRFFTGEPIEPNIEVLLTLDDQAYPVDLEKDCIVTYNNNVYVSLYSESPATVDVALKRDPHIHETFTFLILPVHGYIDITLSAADDVKRAGNVFYMDGPLSYAEFATKIPYDDKFRVPENLTFTVLTLDTGDESRNPVILEYTDDYVLKATAGKTNGAVKVIFEASDENFHSFTDSSYEIIIVNNYTGNYVPDLSQKFIRMTDDEDLVIEESDTPMANAPEKEAVGGFFKKLFSFFRLTK